jgi:16S rRNA (cytidine1402-2'-O)-methyltransferase
MNEGSVVALVSDAGMPLVSDPGFVLVRACVAAGLAVEVLPGPSAALSALVASALPADRWQFVGFLPRKRSELERVFAQPETVVAFESPRRLGASLKTLAAVDPERPAAVCRELTKIHEEVVRGSASELAARYGAAAPKGEIVLVVGPARETAPGIDAPLDALRRLVDAGAKPRPAAGVVAELTGVSANALYRALTEARTDA